MFDLLLASLSVTALLVIWFNTHFLQEYAQVIGLGRLVRIEEWMKFREVHKDAQYLQFLVFTYAGQVGPIDGRIARARAFFVRLISCPYCLGFWLSLGAASAVGHWRWTLAVYTVALLLKSRVS